jgi:hypothetical protein
LQGASYPETWLNEGLSTAAEHVYLETYEYEWVDYFNKSSEVSKGNNFFVWDSDLADYSTAYLFFQWLRIQAAKNDKDFTLYKKICDSPYGDYRAVVNAVKELINPSLDSWDKIIRAWLTANYMNTPKSASGGLDLYGYKDEFELVKVKIQPYRSNGKQALLRPGEGVYSAISGNTYTVTGTSGVHIGYAGLNKLTQPLFNTTDKKYSGKYLLTYNGHNDSIYPIRETGYTTGVRILNTEPRSVTNELSAPLRVDGLLPIR